VPMGLERSREAHRERQVPQPSTFRSRHVPHAVVQSRPALSFHLIAASIRHGDGDRHQLDMDADDGLEWQKNSGEQRYRRSTFSRRGTSDPAAQRQVVTQENRSFVQVVRSGIGPRHQSEHRHGQSNPHRVPKVA
jgi:hypothetical protein